MSLCEYHKPYQIAVMYNPSLLSNRIRTSNNKLNLISHFKQINVQTLRTESKQQGPQNIPLHVEQRMLE